MKKKKIIEMLNGVQRQIVLKCQSKVEVLSCQ